AHARADLPVALDRGPVEVLLGLVGARDRLPELLGRGADEDLVDVLRCGHGTLPSRVCGGDQFSACINGCPVSRPVLSRSRITASPPWTLLSVAVAPWKPSCSTVSRHTAPMGSMVQVTRCAGSAVTASSHSAENVCTSLRGGSASMTVPSAARLPSAL